MSIKKLGICMDGGEEEFLATISEAAKGKNDFLYVEIGLAYGTTFRAVWDEIKWHREAKAIGLELPTWVGLDAIERNFKGEPLIMGPNGPLSAKPLNWGATVYLGRSQETLTSPEWKYPIDVAFVDGCHGKPCVMADFLALEPHIKPGGLVIFHDAGDKEQGGDIQPHCQQPIGVLEALDELKLHTTDYGTAWFCERPGWEFVKFIPCENKAAVFRKSGPDGPL